MTTVPPKARLLGSFLFIAGTVVMAIAITGLLPSAPELTLDSDLMAQVVVSLGMLLVATVMVSYGMFFIVYGGEGGDTEPGRGPGPRW